MARKNKKIRVGIIFGGQSAEHEVSLQSAKNVVEALDTDKYEPVLVGIDKTGKWLLPDQARFLLNETNPELVKLNSADSKSVALVPQSSGEITALGSGKAVGESIDVAFPILHGPMGEDGTVQGLLTLAGVPFVGADVLGSAVGMDKDVMKRLLHEAGIPVPKFRVYRTPEDVPGFDEITDMLGLPVFVKPANLGSSVGVSKAKDEEDFQEAVAEAFTYDTKILVEECISGREVECAVLGNDDPAASGVGEVIPHHEFYSYEAKYIDEDGAELKIPADLPEMVTEEVRRLAEEAFRTLECAGLARVDFFVREDGTVFVSEINTIPGFTKISMYPKLWEEAGVSYSQLIDRLIQLAIKRFEKEKRLKRSR